MKPGRPGRDPFCANSVYLGEVYDARQEQPAGTAGFDDGGWEHVSVARELAWSSARADAPPIRATRTLKPVKLTEPNTRRIISTIGQNFAGWGRLRVKGPAGTRVRLRYGELLYPGRHP